LRRISYTDPKSGKALVFLTKNMTLLAANAARYLRQQILKMFKATPVA
jgi:hypothetical protein